ncbi:Tripartite motif containing 37 [Chytriomyces hyalinus]|nr:Tripartite motif containing 37 [Chytriomyces hyalinus]
MAEREMPVDLDDMFKCYICFETLVHPQMCPQCSKMSCDACMRRWLTAHGNHCPHCRVPLSADNLVQCRFMDDLAKQVREAVKHGPFLSSNPGQDVLCKTHNAPLFYFCHSCNDAICSDCAVLGQNHKDHKVEHLQSVYNSHKDSVWTAIKSLFRNIKSLSEVNETVDTHFHTLRAAKAKVEFRHDKIMRLAQQHLDTQFETQAAKLVSFQRGVSHELQRLHDTVSNLQTHLKVSSKLDVIHKSTSVLDIVHKEHPAIAAADALQHHQILAHIPSVDLCFDSTLIPPYESSTLVITGFAAKMRETPDSGEACAVLSNVFSASGVDWRLKVYCNGNKGTHLSVFMQLQDGSEVTSKYQYKIELIRKALSQNPLESQQTEEFPGTDAQSVKSVREFTSDFAVGECWGYTRFYPLELLEPNGFVANDTLEIKFSVRAMDFAQKCRDLQRRLTKMESAAAAPRFKDACDLNSDELEKRNQSQQVPQKSSPSGSASRPRTDDISEIAVSRGISAGGALPQKLSTQFSESPSRLRNVAAAAEANSRPRSSLAGSLHAYESLSLELPARPYTAENGVERRHQNLSSWHSSTNVLNSDGSMGVPPAQSRRRLSVSSPVSPPNPPNGTIFQRHHSINGASQPPAFSRPAQTISIPVRSRNRLLPPLDHPNTWEAVEDDRDEYLHRPRTNDALRQSPSGRLPQLVGASQPTTSYNLQQYASNNSGNLLRMMQTRYNASSSSDSDSSRGTTNTTMLERAVQDASREFEERFSALRALDTDDEDDHDATSQAQHFSDQNPDRSTQQQDHEENEHVAALRAIYRSSEYNHEGYRSETTRSQSPTSTDNSSTIERELTAILEGSDAENDIRDAVLRDTLSRFIDRISGSIRPREDTLGSPDSRARRNSRSERDELDLDSDDMEGMYGVGRHSGDEEEEEEEEVEDNVNYEDMIERIGRSARDVRRRLFDLS